MAKTTKTAQTETAPRQTSGYLTAEVGMSSSGPMAFHVEGHLTRDPSVLQKKDDQDMMVLTGMGIGVGAKAMYGRANGKSDPVADDTNFITLVVRGKMAEKFISEAKKGDKIAVTGKLTVHEGKDPQGNPREEIEILVNNYIMLPKENGKRNKRVSTASRVYTNKDGSAQTETVVTLLTGRVVGTPVYGTSPKGVSYLKGSVALAVPAQKIYDFVCGNRKEEYPEDAKPFMNVVFFGQAADAKAKVFREGAIVSLTGRVTSELYEGKTSYTIMPYAMSMIAWPENKAETPSAPTAQTPAGSSADFVEEDDDDDSLPF